ncbi:uncharacterized protein THITE_2125607 [Thermothielavioides terrestris NRRL 8126]|uniref:Uncharacterized protein n=1 Tax=Thermothielavioides terrestris (strain ATCC 38088 / NRRL 8126) TaxID=578455 RepID=G2QW58_THETT|nr:uncharacterized protein THITE_2125607 [Thermothielavioides terrestris NRRL 8126]AEO63033.1 hypothetical protein THITE_2125607 [Thermothielavioides terrestris NRRL 8126]
MRPKFVLGFVLGPYAFLLGHSAIMSVSLGLASLATVDRAWLRWFPDVTSAVLTASSYPGFPASQWPTSTNYTNYPQHRPSQPRMEMPVARTTFAFGSRREAEIRPAILPGALPPRELVPERLAVVVTI